MGLKRVKNRRDDAVAQVDWQALETLLARHYARQGFQVDHVGTGATQARYDGGIDLKLRRADEYVLVQVKHWNAYKVPHNDVHQLLGVMVNEGATGAILVTSGEFTQAAIEAANRHGHVRLVDGNELRFMLGLDALATVAAQPDRAGEFVSAMNAPLSERSPPQVRSYVPAQHRESRGWLAFAAVGLLVFGFLIWGVLKKTEGTAGPSGSPGVATRRSSPDAEMGQEPLLPAREEIGAAPAGDPCKEVVDHFSGTYIDHCASRHPQPQPTAAEIREQQRRAEEAARVIEATTPEM